MLSWPARRYRTSLEQRTAGQVTRCAHDELLDLASPLRTILVGQPLGERLSRTCGRSSALRNGAVRQVILRKACVSSQTSGEYVSG